MQTFNLEYFLDRKLDLPLNSFKTKANAFCNERPVSLFRGVARIFQGGGGGSQFVKVRVLTRLSRRFRHLL